MVAMPLALSALLVASAPAVLLAAASAPAASLDGELGADDECLAESGGNGSRCALSALQRRGRKRTAVDASREENGGEAAGNASWTPTWSCVGCMQGNSPSGFNWPVAPRGKMPIQHYMGDCWKPCGGRSGMCSWCGAGNACCRYKYYTDPPECQHVKFFPALSWHTCVQTDYIPPTVAPPVNDTMAGTVSRVGNYQPSNKALASPSNAPLLSFYMYRAMGDSDYAPENVNTANLAGIMWYLHNEVVVLTPRKFGITRIIRMKVQLKAPQPLYEVGMNFGVRYAFDSGRCTGPWSCDKQYDKYGYFVGCNYVGNFPTNQWHKANKYPQAIWYSMPGPCSNRRFHQHDQQCVDQYPGGACSGVPSGRGNCTYSAEPAGEIRIDELEGITDYQFFVSSGGKEYIHRWDRGWGVSFWDGKEDPAKCAQRVQQAENLFAAKYGPPEFVGTPKCDFYQHDFYKHSPAK